MDEEEKSEEEKEEEKEIDERLEDMGVDPNDPCLDDDVKRELAGL